MFSHQARAIFTQILEIIGKIMEQRSAHEIEDSTDKLLKDLKAVVHDGEELLRAGAEDLSERGLAAREKLSTALQMARETQKKIQKSAIEGCKATDRMIREKPYQSVGVAFGVGLLLGLILNRK
jgi:ElaB/YqjD/DUF883 family membrane-anchored ribosome-binding protein